MDDKTLAYMWMIDDPTIARFDELFREAYREMGVSEVLAGEVYHATLNMICDLVDGKRVDITAAPDLPPENWSSLYVSIWAGFRYSGRRQVWAGSGIRRSRSFASCVKRRCFWARE
jgi:hypothetical protein